MSSRSILALAAATLLAAATSHAAGAPPAVEVHGLKFTPPIAVSAPAPAGLDALLVVHPADARAGGEKLSLTAIAFPKDSGMTDADLLDYVKTTFLATSDAGKPVERSFLGRKVKGQSLEKRIPAPSRAEVYVVTRKGGDKVVLAFVFGPGFAAEAEAAIAGIASTMTE
jgi:hypothetical protein